MTVRRPRLGRALRLGAALGAVAGLAALAGCGSSGHDQASVATVATVATVASPTTTPPATSRPADTVAHQLPTVGNCGGGAYKPATLLITCTSGDAGVMATAVTWQSWSTTAATGSGTVHLLVHGQETTRPATLTLADVETGAVGPQFRRLTVAWTGPSPTGVSQTVYQLQAGG